MSVVDDSGLDVSEHAERAAATVPFNVEGAAESGDTVSRTGQTNLAPREQGAAAWQSRVRRCSRSTLQRIDYSVVAYLQERYGVEIPTPLPAASARQVRILWICAAAFIASSSVACTLQWYCLVKGWYILAVGRAPEECRMLEHWVLCYSLTLVMVPFCFAFAAPMALWWVASAGITRNSVPSSCEESVPRLWHFVDQTQLLGFITAIFVMFASVMLRAVRRRWDELQREWSGQGPLAQEVVAQILAEQPLEEVPEGSECPICLEAGTPRSGRWHQLPCSHMFHEQCLLEWLRRAQHCPLCRLNLRQAYARSRSSEPQEV